MRPGLTSPYVLLLCCCLFVTAILTVLVWRQRPRTGATELAALLGAILVWGGVYVVGLVTYDPPTRQLVERFVWVGTTTAPIAWFAFALTYTGRRRWRMTRLVGGLLSVSAIVVGLVFTNASHGLIWTNSEVIVTAGIAVVRQSTGPLFWPITLSYYALTLVGTYLLLDLVLSGEGLYVDQSAALVVGSVIPLVANVLSIFGLAPVDGFDMTPYAFTVSGVAFGYALVRSDLFEFVPATRTLGRDAVIDNMLDSVLIVNEHDQIIETNPVAEYAFGIDRETVLGTPLSDLLDTDVTVPPPNEMVEITVPRGNRTFEMTASPLSDWQNRTIGHILVFRDVTERTLREQRLSVLNRVLRHNLRNQLNVVDINAEILAEQVPDAEREYVEQIRDATSDLMSVGEKARTVDQVVDTDTDPVEVDATAVVESVVEKYTTATTGVTVETDLPERLCLTCSHPGLFDIIVENLVENAIEHNDSDDPFVGVRLEKTAESDPQAVLVVTDNGPTIPDAELDALDSGVETALRHSSSLGLWTVNWCVQQFGGTLSFETSTHGGNRVEVTLPVNALWTPPAEDRLDEETASPF